MEKNKYKNLDVLFVIPPLYRIVNKNCDIYPLGLGYIVSSLNEKNIKSLIYNSDYQEIIPDSTYGNIKNSIRKIFGKKFFHLIEAFEKNILSHFYNKYIFESKKWSKFYETVNNENLEVWSQFKTVIEKTNPKIIGISSKMNDISSVLILSKIAKEQNPEIKIIIGGPSATTCSSYLINNDNVDYLVLGEGEITSFDLINCILTGEDTPNNLKNINGIMYKDSIDIVQTTQRSLIQNLDEIPFPDREALFYLDINNQIKNLYLNSDILTSRGCPYPCKFCACHTIWNTRKPRIRSNENIIDEILYLYNKYNQKEFIFWDDLFTINRDKIVDLCNKIIEKELNIEWICLVRLNTIDKELLEIMKRAGCKQIQIGIESGNDRILSYIGKKISKKDILDKLPVLRNSGIKWLAFFIIGFPTETIEEINDTLNFIKEINPDNVMVSIFAPYPGTEFFDLINRDCEIGDDFIKNDTFYVHKNYTGTINQKEFKKIAYKALKMNSY